MADAMVKSWHGFTLVWNACAACDTLRAALNPTDVIRRRAEVTVRTTQSGAILINMTTGRCWRLNEVGAAFFREIDDGNVFNEVLIKLGPRYNIGRDVLERDLLHLVQTLLDADLIERAEP